MRNIEKPLDLGITELRHLNQPLMKNDVSTVSLTPNVSPIHISLVRSSHPPLDLPYQHAWHLSAAVAQRSLCRPRIAPCQIAPISLKRLIRSPAVVWSILGPRRCQTGTTEESLVFNHKSGNPDSRLPIKLLVWSATGSTYAATSWLISWSCWPPEWFTGYWLNRFFNTDERSWYGTK